MHIEHVLDLIHKLYFLSSFLYLVHRNAYLIHFWDLLALQELGYAQLQAVAGSVSDPTRFQQVSLFQIMVCSDFSLQSCSDSNCLHLLCRAFRLLRSGCGRISQQVLMILWF